MALKVIRPVHQQVLPSQLLKGSSVQIGEFLEIVTLLREVGDRRREPVGNVYRLGELVVAFGVAQSQDLGEVRVTELPLFVSYHAPAPFHRRVNEVAFVNVKTKSFVDCRVQESL